ncbi:isopentenyl pyrophosphate isomerase [Ligilactobacillus apodemi DSM 16634 = JCM 16172]|uniref:Isopentenyl-diphosphate delta-isomerase n=1 Tax=Ligilactobacillus apodemi DSM 16634 = JCM 16172 TaxID=1423724 RepID=A0A0R1TR47_9LACO|nr:type 2 isopentenyl-diphosphate Delta-isomerase [Ligilactobacillus apodemi]KRL83921.1 isopentenyl pyrophosphate isomerase [Ligilactobacillus apodemi DSM 16634 = JCM 16172]MCR1900774.1 type 2 isopentenyl-diphosphate Delta-isomerase [Ligilactobacillus apodemi]
MDAHAHRKDEHVFIAEKFYQENSTNGLEKIKLVPATIPELSLDEIDLSSQLAGKNIAVPFFINAMTGGSPQTDKINQKLATVAAKTGLALATGSQSVALKSETYATGFRKLRSFAPKNLLIGNLGADHPLENCQKAIEMFAADALEIHLNVAQELVMPEGDRSFYWLDNLKNLNQNLRTPLIIKEVGGGISPLILPKLAEIGIKYVDLSGKGGTNFIAIENERRKAKEYDFLTYFGLTTAETLILARPFSNDFSFTASGGIKTALEIIKCLVLGADNVGISGHFLHLLLHEGEEALIAHIEALKEQLAAIMLLLGCKNVTELKQAPYLLTPDLLSYAQQAATNFNRHS